MPPTPKAASFISAVRSRAAASSLMIAAAAPGQPWRSAFRLLHAVDHVDARQRRLGGGNRALRDAVASRHVTRKHELSARQLGRPRERAHDGRANLRAGDPDALRQATLQRRVHALECRGILRLAAIDRARSLKRTSPCFMVESCLSAKAQSRQPRVRRMGRRARCSCGRPRRGRAWRPWSSRSRHAASPGPAHSPSA